MVETKKKRQEPKVNIDIYKAWCKACGICVAFCPTGVLEKDESGYPFVKDIEKCINCGWCEIRCPDFAITVEKRAKVSRTGEERVERRDETAKGEEEIGPERSITAGE